MRSRGKVALAALAVATVTLSGCGLSEDEQETTDVEAGSIDPTALEGVSLGVGSKDFDEQLLLGQLTLLTLKAAGADVADETNSQGSTQARQKLINGGSDVYWDYTGTGWLVYLGHDTPIQDPQEQYDAVAKEDLAKSGLVWGPLSPFNNTYAMATTEDFASENDITTDSDMATYLEENPDATVCVESEFASRPDGYPGFQKAYGMDVQNTKSLGTGVIYPQIENGTCDFGEVFTTDGRIAALGLQPLEDDQAFFPLYNGVPIVREDTNTEHPEVLEVLAPLAEALDTETMAELNAQVSADGLPPEQVAETFLQDQGFIQ